MHAWLVFKHTMDRRERRYQDSRNREQENDGDRRSYCEFIGKTTHILNHRRIKRNKAIVCMTVTRAS